MEKGYPWEDERRSGLIFFLHETNFLATRKHLTMLPSRLSLAALGALFLSGACNTSEPLAEVQTLVENSPPARPLYSPFVVDLAHEHLPFRQITFKDVGMSLAPEDRAHVYELVAEELREGLRAEGISATVNHDARWSDPEHHRSCRGGHIYVDMWQGGTPEDGTGTWGYSLWSGCEAASEFGRGDVPGRGDGVAGAQPLARHIVAGIQRAADARCFRKHC